MCVFWPSHRIKQLLALLACGLWMLEESVPTFDETINIKGLCCLNLSASQHLWPVGRRGKHLQKEGEKRGTKAPKVAECTEVIYGGAAAVLLYETNTQGQEKCHLKAEQIFWLSAARPSERLLGGKEEETSFISGVTALQDNGGLTNKEWHQCGQTPWEDWAALWTKQPSRMKNTTHTHTGDRLWYLLRRL